MTLALEPISATYQKLCDEIASCCKQAQRSPQEIRLIAVSKTQASTRIAELFQLGVKDFGENYAQELLEKASELQELAINWHFIGHLQSNKIAKLVATCSRICSVASFDHAQRIAKSAQTLNKTPFPILLDVNFDNELGKHGCRPEEVVTLATKIMQELPQLLVEGLFVIPAPLTPAEEQEPVTPKRYQAMRQLADKIGNGRLSLGMSADLRQAIAAGSDEVRVGTSLFGKRPH